jgi:hypothetical protein
MDNRFYAMRFVHLLFLQHLPIRFLLRRQLLQEGAGNIMSFLLVNVPAYLTAGPSIFFLPFRSCHSFKFEIGPMFKALHLA